MVILLKLLGASLYNHPILNIMITGSEQIRQSCPHRLFSAVTVQKAGLG